MMGLAAGGFATLLALAASELLLRITWNRPAGRYIRGAYWKYMLPDAELGFLPKPNTLVEYPRFQASFTTNSQGLRGPEHAAMKMPQIRRIVVLGDSFAWGHGVGTGQAFPEVLEKLVPKVEVINLGVPGFNVRTALQYFERLGAQYQPDIVLLALCQNDIHDLDALERREVGAPSSGQDADQAAPRESGGGAFRTLKQFLDDHSYLYAMCIRAVNANKTMARAAVRCGLKEELAGFELLDDNLQASLINPPPPVQRAVAQVKSDLLRLDASVRSHRGRLLVAMIPSLQAVTPEELVNSIAYTRYDVADFDMDAPYRMLGRFFAEHDIPFVDPLPAFRAAHARGAALYLAGDLHFNREGHRLFAELVAPALGTMLDEQQATLAAQAPDSKHD
ncbi:MAG TPA: GDSL-type esterase/lipase family protein [Phycisphaerae bacterium]|nr:GDSL-type esterase/lipase family protein [Phycisphaerae bacterium]